MPSNYTNRLEQGLLVFRSTYFCNWDQWVFLLMKFHQFATYIARACHNPYLNPPQKRGINFAKILGLWIRVSWSRDVTMELLTSESSSALLVNIIIWHSSQYFSHIFPHLNYLTIIVCCCLSHRCISFRVGASHYTRDVGTCLFKTCCFLRSFFFFGWAWSLVKFVAYTSSM
jgi:hypothetical protein